MGHDVRGIDKQTIGVMLLATGVIVAMFSPQLAGALAPYALPALFFVICFTMISFADDPNSDLLHIDRTTWLFVGWQQAVLPALILAFAIIVDFPVSTVSLMIVTACAGSLFASPTLAGLLDLDRKRALQSMVLSTLLMPVSLYAYLSILHASHIQLDLGEYLSRAAVFLVIPFTILSLYRAIIVFLPTVVTSAIGSGSRWASIGALLVFGIGIMHPVSIQLHTNPLLILFYLCLVTSLSLVMFLFTNIVMYYFGPRQAMTAGVLSGLRNVGLCLALVGDHLGAELSLYVGLSMLPVFLAPAVLHFMTSAGRDAQVVGT